MSQEVDPDLDKLIRDELSNITIDKWGYYFPLMLAIWRYIELRHPGVLGELHARYADEPEISGVGAQWFMGELMNNAELLDVLDAIAYGVVDRLPKQAMQRGFVTSRDLPDLELGLIGRLRSVIDREVEKLSGESGVTG
jgi:hypothetical protein